MGIQYLNNYFKKNANYESIIKTNFHELSNRVIAIDTSIYLYRFLAENSLLENLYVMISLFKYYNIIHIFVFDGRPPVEKLNLISKRNIEKNNAEKECNEMEKKLFLAKNENQRNEIIASISSLKKKFIRLKKNDFNNVRKLFDAFGVYYIEAIGEADELCARLVIKKYAYACLSEDMDLFLYGCPRVLRYLSLSNQSVILYHLDKILKDLDLTFQEFKEICVVSGTDYNIQNGLNLYKILEYFEEYKEFKKLNNSKDFYTWLDENQKCIDNLYKLCNTYYMFQTYNNKLPNLKTINLSKETNIDKIKEIMKPEGFIFLE